MMQPLTIHGTTYVNDTTTDRTVGVRQRTHDSYGVRDPVKGAPTNEKGARRDTLDFFDSGWVSTI